MCVFQNPVSNLTMTVVDLHLFTLMFRKIVGQKKIPKNEQVNKGSFFRKMSRWYARIWQQKRIQENKTITTKYKQKQLEDFFIKIKAKERKRKDLVL